FNAPLITKTKESAKFPIKYLHPKAEVVLVVKCSGFIAQPSLAFNDDNKIDFPMIFLESSFFTWMIKSEVPLNIAFITLLAVLIIIYFFLILKSKIVMT